jgi:hypothetical protein
MSNEDQKVKHSKRIQQKKNYVRKQVGIAKAHHMEVENPHMFAKHAAMDCGISECPICSNPRKLYKEKTIQEQRFEQKELIE